MSITPEMIESIINADAALEEAVRLRLQVIQDAGIADVQVLPETNQVQKNNNSRASARRPLITVSVVSSESDKIQGSTRPQTLATDQRLITEHCMVMVDIEGSKRSDNTGVLRLCRLVMMLLNNWRPTKNIDKLTFVKRQFDKYDPPAWIWQLMFHGERQFMGFPDTPETLGILQELIWDSKIIQQIYFDEKQVEFEGNDVVNEVAV